MFLVAGLRFANAEGGPLVQPGEVQALGNNVETALRSVEAAANANNIEGVANAILRGIGQLFIANDVEAGTLLVVGIAVASRIAAALALVGSGVVLTPVGDPRGRLCHGHSPPVRSAGRDLHALGPAGGDAPILLRHSRFHERLAHKPLARPPERF